MTTKTPTPQAVSALLKRSGFNRSTKQKSRIRGLTEHSEGFVVSQLREGEVTVEYRSSSLRRSPSPADAWRLLDQKFSPALRAAGWRVDARLSGPYPALVVREGEPQPRSVTPN